MSRKSRKNVGVIGLGIIGSRVAAGLRAAGYQVYVWNRSAKPAPNFLGSPAQVAESAEVIQLFVADAAALFEVIEAMGDALTPKHVIICSGTVGPEAVLEAAQIVETRGAQFLDAPFTGSKLAAEKRQLVYYIGGAEHTFLKAKPFLEVMSKGIVRIGEVGHASSVKVVTNMISAVTTQVLAEALSIIQKAGLEPEILAAAIEHNACRSGVVDLKLPKMIAGDYEPHFSLKHMFKDVQLGIHMANALDIEIPATTVTAGVMYGALNQGWGDLDYAALFKNYATPEPVDELPALPHVAMSVEEVLAEAADTREIGNEPEPEKPGKETIGGGNRGESGSSPVDVAPPLPTERHATSVEEAVPTAAAAQMIEVMLSHSEGQGASRGPLSEYSSGAVSPTLDAAKGPEVPAEGAGSKKPETNETKTAESGEGQTTKGSAEAGESKTPEGDEGKKPESNEGKTIEGQTADAGAPADAKAEPVKTETPAEDATEPPAPPKNFVRRWFVARSGG